MLLNVIFSSLSIAGYQSSVIFIQACNILCTDFFNEECKEDAEDECNEFLVEVPLSEEFNSTAFDYFC